MFETVVIDFTEVKPDQNSLIDTGPATPLCGMPVFQDKHARAIFSHSDSSPALKHQHRAKRIIDGYRAEPYSHPWIGIIMLDNAQICGVSLIKHNAEDTFTSFGLTAAHCFDDHFLGDKE